MVIYTYKTSFDNSVRKQMLPTLGTALALARFDGERTRSFFPINVMDGAVIYAYAEIICLTEMTSDGKVIVTLPVLESENGAALDSQAPPWAPVIPQVPSGLPG